MTGVTPPGDATAASAITTAEEKLRDAVTDKCSPATLTGLDACDTDPVNAGTCLTCTAWRRAADSVRSAYGPQ